MAFSLWQIMRNSILVTILWHLFCCRKNATKLLLQNSCIFTSVQKVPQNEPSQLGATCIFNLHSSSLDQMVTELPKQLIWIWFHRPLYIDVPEAMEALNWFSKVVSGKSVLSFQVIFNISVWEEIQILIWIWIAPEILIRILSWKPMWDWCWIWDNFGILVQIQPMIQIGVSFAIF